jgi:RNA polymerase sigma factor (sigma-70 family)
MPIVPISGAKRTARQCFRDALVEENLDLVVSIAKTLALKLPPSFALADLVGAGNIGLIKAAAEYDPDSHGGAPFRLYARVLVRGAIIDSVRRKKYIAGTHRPLDEAPQEATARDNVIEMEIDGGRLQRRVRAAIAELPEAERELVTRLYMGEASLPQIEVRLQRCASDATRALHESAMAMLRARLAA